MTIQTANRAVNVMIVGVIVGTVIVEAVTVVAVTVVIVLLCDAKKDLVSRMLRCIIDW